MSARTLLPLLLALAAPAKETSVSKDALALDFSLAREGQVLKVRYTLRNQSKERVYVLDQMVASSAGSYRPLPKALIVREEAPGTAALVRGFVDPGHPVLFQYAPAARALDPGAALEGTAEVPLPLQAQHPYGRLAPLQKPAQAVVLQIGYVSEAVEWVSYPMQGGGPLRGPALPSVVQGQRFVRSGPRALP